MDPERQPLLCHRNTDSRCRRYRPLTHEEVLTARQEVIWRRSRFFLIIMFWAIIAMFLSIITCILVTSPRCNDVGLSMAMIPSVPPVHMTFAPLIFSERAHNNEHVYAA